MIRALIDYAPPQSERLVLYHGEPYEHRGVNILPFWEYLT